jgi:catechol 2,3-dioxygenase-like lactoylglutathione lyase family enzyme
MAKALGFDHLQLAMPRGAEESAREFYGQILGLKELPKPAPLSGRGGVSFQCGLQQLHLGVEEDFRAAKKAHPAFEVDDLDEIAATLQARGYPVIEDQVQLEGSRRLLRRIRSVTDADPTHAFAARSEAPVEPLGQCTVGLQAQPLPGQLDQERASAFVAGLADALLVAVARRLAIALWRYLQNGEIPPGAELKPLTA